MDEMLKSNIIGIDIMATWIDLRAAQNPQISAALASLYHFEWQYGIHHHSLHWSRIVEYPWVLLRTDGEFNSVVLDVGAGEGILAPYMSRRCKKVYALDRDVPGKRFRELVKLFPNLELIHSDAIKIPLPDKSVDTVVCISVLEHSDTPVEGILHEMIRVLNDGGQILLTIDVNIDNPTILVEIEKALGTRLSPLWDMQINPKSTRLSKEGDLTSAFAVAAIVIIKGKLKSLEERWMRDEEMDYYKIRDEEWKKAEGTEPPSHGDF